MLTLAKAGERNPVGCGLECLMISRNVSKLCRSEIDDPRGDGGQRCMRDPLDSSGSAPAIMKTQPIHYLVQNLSAGDVQHSRTNCALIVQPDTPPISTCVAPNIGLHDGDVAASLAAAFLPGVGIGGVVCGPT